MIAGLLSVALGLAAASDVAPPTICYDRAIVGRISDYENMIGLAELVKSPPNTLMVGERFDVAIDVDYVFLHDSLPETVDGRVILTHRYRDGVELLMLLRHGPIRSDHENEVWSANWGFIPATTKDFPWQVVYVTPWRDHFHADDPDYPPRCDRSNSGANSPH
jgi:hypothetical protein